MKIITNSPKGGAFKSTEDEIDTYNGMVDDIERLTKQKSGIKRRKPITEE